MFSSTVSIQTGSGRSIIATMEAVEKAAQPTVGDLLYAGQLQRSRILDRTARGVDVNGSAFAPYSKNGPYCYYPSKYAKNRRAAVLRTAKKIGARDKVTRLGIKFPSYGAFKASLLGRLGVDLRGPSAPHMLQAIIIKVAGFILQGTDNSVSDNDTPANEIILGIYGEEGARADGHNRGTLHLPQRKFMGASSTDKDNVLRDILSRVGFRVRLALGGGK